MKVGGSTEVAHGEEALKKCRFLLAVGTKKIIDATKAYYVIGSDVKGSMGAEPIPFGDKATAEKFSKGHHGKKVSAYKDVVITDVKPKKKKMLKMKHEKHHPNDGHDHGSGSAHK